MRVQMRPRISFNLQSTMSVESGERERKLGIITCRDTVFLVSVKGICYFALYLVRMGVRLLFRCRRLIRSRVATTSSLVL